MIKTTRWKPDTCKCVVDYTWDDFTSQNLRQHTFKSVIKCPEHSTLSDRAVYDAVVEENTSKGKLLNAIFTDQLFSAHVGDVLNKESGQTTKDFLPGHLPIISYDPIFNGTSRQLRVSVPFMSLTEREDLEKLANSLLGLGKAIVTG